jgi:hypothetical protein
MDSKEMEDVLRNLDRRTSRIEQILPTLIDEGDGGTAGPGAEVLLDRLRGDIRRLAEDLVAVDRRDATQHGGVKGELAHVVRRIAKLEAAPGLRHAR